MTTYLLKSHLPEDNKLQLSCINFFTAFNYFLNIFASSWISNCSFSFFFFAQELENERKSLKSWLMHKFCQYCNVSLIINFFCVKLHFKLLIHFQAFDKEASMTHVSQFLTRTISLTYLRRKIIEMLFWPKQHLSSSFALFWRSDLKALLTETEGYSPRHTGGPFLFASYKLFQTLFYIIGDRS